MMWLTHGDSHIVRSCQALLAPDHLAYPSNMIPHGIDIPLHRSGTVEDEDEITADCSQRVVLKLVQLACDRLEGERGGSHAFAPRPTAFYEMDVVFCDRSWPGWDTCWRPRAVGGIIGCVAGRVIVEHEIVVHVGDIKQ